MRNSTEDAEDDYQQEIDRLIKQRYIVRRILNLLKQIREEKRNPITTLVTKKLLENYKFYVYRTDTNQVLARGIEGFDAAKDKANQLRKSLNLKWDQVRFKTDRSVSGSLSSTGTDRRNQSNLVNPAGGKRIEYAKRYNPSKRMTFRGYTDSHGNFHDLD
jgi:hypothetical protein